MSIFTRDGRVADREALKSVAVGKGSRVPRPTVREDGAKVVTLPRTGDGLAEGQVIYHADGRVSSRVTPRPIALRMR